MLKLVDIKKDYVNKDLPTVHALKGITINFRRSEFVAILGQSGCGKTTLLNIVGGLDRYTSGDLIIEGKSTKDYSDRDWDTYRNHSIGFVFQSYNLITHINVLANVELALTISGISKAERRKRSLEALKTVGLEGMEKKMPNQLSGGQMQRVAIARALVNNPEILLADEPTGALDSETSLQIMDLLKEVAKDRLVIMVTHNPELAHDYATRIVTAKDGLILDDSKPYEGETPKELEKAKKKREQAIAKGQKKLSSMSFFTALGLSFNNMKTKRGRTFLTAFAGSIGIIGIALILSTSYGFNGYIGQVQEDALTSYPMQVQQTSVDASSAMASIIGSIGTAATEKTPDGEVGMDSAITDLVTKLVNSVNKNNVKGFKAYLNQPEIMSQYQPYLSGISYSYNTDFTTYTKIPNRPIEQAYPVNINVTDYSCISNLPQIYQDTMKSAFDSVANTLSSYFTNSTFSAFTEMIPNVDPKTLTEREYSDVLTNQYDVVYGNLPQYGHSDEVVLVLDQNNNINDFLLYSLGLRNPQNLVIDIAKGLASSRGVPADIVKDITNLPEPAEFPMTYENICKCEYYVPLSYQLYNPDSLNSETSDTLRYYKKSTDEIANYLKNSSDDPNSDDYVLKMKIVGIVRIKPGITSASLNGAIGYMPSFMNDYVIGRTANPIQGGKYDSVVTNPVKGQLKLADTYDVLRGEPFYVDETETKTNMASKIYKMTEKDAKMIMPDNPRKLIDDYKIKGYGIIGVENIAHNSFKMNLDGTTYQDLPSPTPVEGMNAGVIYSGSIFDVLKTRIGYILYDSGVILLDENYKGEIPDEGVVVSCGYTYSYKANNPKASTYKKNLTRLGWADINNPVSINFFPKDFTTKDKINELIDEFNTKMEIEVREKHKGEGLPEETIKQLVQQEQVSLTDSVGLLMNSVQTIVNAVSYVLIAFVSVSLIVSSIMIAIITYVSVLERTKEIGILRSIGARKRDVSNVFNAETLIIGLAAGLLGVGVSLVLDIPITILISKLAAISITIVVPWYGIVFLPIISIALTVVSGFIPSIIASKKDPVIALRSE